MLARRPWATGELRDRLLRRHDETDVDAAIAKLVRLGYLDDVARTKQYIETSRAGERGARLLREELLRKGVDAGIVDATLREHDDAEAALRAAQRRLGSMGELDDERRAQRLRGFLARRGFGGDTIARTLSSVLGGVSAPS
jgi:regulatory protein